MVLGHLVSSATAIAITLVATPAYGAIGPVADLEILNAIVNPDGVPRSAVTAGGGVQGPLIIGNKGDNFQINVVNNLNDDNMLLDTSIHWHGFFQKGSSWADGPAFVNQCPVVAGNSFLYDFSVPGQAGTFWYHSHYSTQYCDGLRGPIVVYDPSDPFADMYDVDDESTVITLADWYHGFAPDLEQGFPTPNANLLNGLGRAVQGNATDLAVVTVEKGKKYRFRLVNMACDPNYLFHIDNHVMTVIEADGINHRPTEVDQVQIFAGQRYSFVLDANQDIDNYWIRFKAFPGGPSFDGGVNSAILRYVGAPEGVEPRTDYTPTNPLVESQLVPFENPGAPGTPGRGNADININLDLNFNGAVFTVNDVPYVQPPLPVLLQILSGTKNPEDLLPEDSFYVLEANKSVEVSIPAGTAVGGPHPFHLHGHAFDIVRSAGSDVYNYDNPPRRDVVSIGNPGGGDNVTIRFSTDNPGPWFFHCHIDWHLERGLAIVFAERPREWNTTENPPAAWFDLCPAFDNAHGNN